MHRVMEMRLAFRRTTQRRDVELLIRALRLDGYCGGSGYEKEYIWHRLKAAELNGSQRRRLQEIALRYLHKRMNREFWYMCRFIGGRADDAIRERVAKLAQSKDDLVRKRASLLLAYLESPVAGAAARRNFRSELSSRRVWRW